MQRLVNRLSALSLLSFTSIASVAAFATPVAAQEAALEEIAADPSRIDLVVLDVMLPGINGFTVASRMRARGWLTPILMLTTESSAERKREGKDAGATGWIVKPFDPAQLVATMQRVLR